MLIRQYRQKHGEGDRAMKSHAVQQVRQALAPPGNQNAKRGALRMQCLISTLQKVMAGNQMCTRGAHQLERPALVLPGSQRLKEAPDRLLRLTWQEAGEGRGAGCLRVDCGVQLWYGPAQFCAPAASPASIPYISFSTQLSRERSRKCRHQAAVPRYQGQASGCKKIFIACYAAISSEDKLACSCKIGKQVRTEKGPANLAVPDICTVRNAVLRWLVLEGQHVQMLQNSHVL